MLSNFSVRKPFTIVVAVIIIAILGVVSLTNMSASLLPSMNLPYAVVSTTYIGASPELVELAVTRPIEQSMASISNIKSVRSVSRENMSMVILEFTQTANMDSAVVEMRESLDMIKAYMPEGVGSPIIMKLNPDMMPVMVLSASVENQKISESSKFLENKVIPEIESVPGVASVNASGLIENEIHVILRDEKIEKINKNIKKKVEASMRAAALAQARALAQTGTAQLAPSVQGQVPDTAAQPQVPAVQPQIPPIQPQIPKITITADMVSGILKGQNFSMPAGYIVEEGVDYLVRTGDKIADVDELKNMTLMTLPISGIDPVKLQDVADIVELDNSGKMYTKVNGNDAVILVLQKQSEYATADVAKSVRAKIEDITRKNEGVALTALMDQGKYIDTSVNSIAKNLIFGGILAILILLVFLRDFKPTIVVGLAIPISLVTAFVMMYFAKITLNLVSMGGLALGVGMLVDNSIVVIENIYRMRNEGASATTAAIEGARQVSGAITSSTLTTIAVFIPILFTEGITRQIFMDMGLTITFSLIASLVVALTLVPMVASGIMVKNNQKEHRILDAVLSGYTKLLSFSLRYKWIVVLTVIALFVGSIAGAMKLGTEFFPATNSNQLNVNIKLPKGSVFEDTIAAADKVIGIISEIEDVETVGALTSGGGRGMGRMFMGRRGSGVSNSDSISMYILLKEDKVKTSGEIVQIIRNQTEAMDFEVSVSDTGGMDVSAMSGGKISIGVKGREFDMLEKIATDVAKMVSQVEGTIEVSNGLEETSPEVRVIVDKAKSITNGLTVAQVYMGITGHLKEDGASTALSIGVKDYNIFVKEEGAKAGTTRENLGNLKIDAPSGKKVAVKDIATIQEAQGFSSINRSNHQRYVTVTGDIAEGFNIGRINEDIQKQLDAYEVPEGYSITMGGEREMIESSFKDLYLMLALAIVFIYLIMVAQFQSLLSPFIVMFTIPLAFTGGFFALMITGKPISVVAFIGLIILSGIVVNNGIVFVDYVNQLRASGLSIRDSIIKTGNVRLRPIFMTSLTTIFSLSTMAVGLGSGTEMIQPMAITAIGGLIYATLLTLIFIPVLYSVFHRKDKAISKEVTPYA